MRPERLSPRDRRALAAGGAVVAVALAWAGGVRPYLAAVMELRSRIAAERELLGRERALLEQGGAYGRLFDEGAARLLDLAPRLLPGANDAAAGAALARLIREHAVAAGVLLVQVAPLEVEERSGVAAVGVRVRAESDLEGLLMLLTTLTEGAKLVRVEGLRIQAAGGAQPADAPEVLTSEFTAYGLTLRTVPAESEARDAAARAEPGGR